jgi:hypothetical protein
MGPKGMLTDENDTIVIGWTLAMQECGLGESTLQQPFFRPLNFLIL